MVRSTEDHRSTTKKSSLTSATVVALPHFLASLSLPSPLPSSPPTLSSGQLLLVLADTPFHPPHHLQRNPHFHLHQMVFLHLLNHLPHSSPSLHPPHVERQQRRLSPRPYRLKPPLSTRLSSLSVMTSTSLQLLL